MSSNTLKLAATDKIPDGLCKAPPPSLSSLIAEEENYEIAFVARRLNVSKRTENAAELCKIESGPIKGAKNNLFYVWRVNPASRDTDQGCEPPEYSTSISKHVVPFNLREQVSSDPSISIGLSHRSTQRESNAAETPQVVDFTGLKINPHNYPAGIATRGGSGSLSFSGFAFCQALDSRLTRRARGDVTLGCFPTFLPENQSHFGLESSGQNVQILKIEMILILVTNQENKEAMEKNKKVPKILLCRCSKSALDGGASLHYCAST
ncbi:hypothetical protein TSAR_005876, partial [Trichomalopsis sarcophagae]